MANSNTPGLQVGRFVAPPNRLRFPPRHSAFGRWRHLLACAWLQCHGL